MTFVSDAEDPDSLGGLPAKRTQPRLIICEGHSDYHVLSALIRTCNLTGLQIHIAKGRDNFTPALRGARVLGYSAILVVSDNDDDPKASFDLVCEKIRAAGYTPPSAPRVVVASAFGPHISVLMIPWDDVRGAIETLCLPALEVLFANKVPCLDEFCRCTEVDPNWGDTHRSEMRVECLLSCTQESEPKMGLGHFVARHTCPLDFEHECFRRVSERLRVFASSPTWD